MNVQQHQQPQSDNDDVIIDEEESVLKDNVCVLDPKKLHKAMKDVAKGYNQTSLHQKSVNTMEKVLTNFLMVVLDHSEQKQVITEERSYSKQKRKFEESSPKKKIEIQDIQRAMIELNLDFLLPNTGVSINSSKNSEIESMNEYLYEDD